MEFIYLLLILIIAFAAHLLIKMKAEQSLFITICSFFIIMFASGLVSNLLTGYYIIVTLALLSAIFIMYKAVNRQIKILEFITPGIAFFIIAYTIYYFSTQGALLHMWDEATHWGTSAKKMFYMRDLWTSGLQTIASPVYNQVILITTGYKESALYLSQWTLYLACIVLPMSAIKWKRSYLAGLFGLVAVFLVSTIFEDGNLSLYADGILSMLFASLFLSWHLEEKRNYRRFIWMLPGIFALVQIKSGSGISLAAILIVFMLISNAVNLKKELGAKKVYIKNIVTLGASFVTIIASQLMIKSFEKSFLGVQNVGSDTVKQLLTSIPFIAFAVFLTITIALFVIYSINIFRDKPSKKINLYLIISSAISFVLLIGVTFYQTILRPDFDVRTTFINYFKAYEKTYLLKMPVMYLIALIAVIFIMNILLSQKKERRKYIAFYATGLFLSGAFLYGVLYAYLSSFSLGEAVNTASFDRYVGTAILFASLFAMMPLLNNSKNAFKQLIAPCAPLVVCTVLLAFLFNPAYKVTKETSEEASIFRQTEIRGAEYVKEKIGTDSKVFLVIQNDQGFVFNWMRYEFTPIVTNGGIWSFGLDGGWNFAWTSAQLKDFLHKANYDYLYLFKSSEHIENHFEALFGDTVPESKTLYKFTYEDEIVFKKVE